MRRLALSLALVCTLAAPAMAAPAAPAGPAVPAFQSWPALSACAEGRAFAAGFGSDLSSEFDRSFGAPVETKDPAVAALLSAGMPILTIGACSMAMFNSSTIGLGQVGLLAVPVTYGTGQAYAGDPLRGLLVGAGSLLAIVGAGWVGAVYAEATSTVMPRNFVSLGGWISGAMFGLVTYTGLASYDAYQTAVRYNERARAAGSSRSVRSDW